MGTSDLVHVEVRGQCTGFGSRTVVLETELQLSGLIVLNHLANLIDAVLFSRTHTFTHINLCVYTHTHTHLLLLSSDTTEEGIRPHYRWL